VTGVIERTQGALDVVPAVLVLQSLADELGNELAAPPRAHAKIQLGDESVVQRYVQSHGLMLAHRLFATRSQCVRGSGPSPGAHPQADRSVRECPPRPNTIEVELMRRYSNSAYDPKRLQTVYQDALESHRSAAPPLPRQPQRRLTSDEATQLVAEYRAGSDIKTLAVRFRINPRTVSATVKRNGVELRRVGMTEAEVDEACRLYGDGGSLARVGKKFERPASSIRDVLERRGVKRRDSHGRRH
jgi:hypothetical protein